MKFSEVSLFIPENHSFKISLQIYSQNDHLNCFNLKRTYLFAPNSHKKDLQENLIQHYKASLTSQMIQQY